MPASLSAPSLIAGSPVFETPKISAYHSWSIPVNWAGGVIEEVSYRTEVIVSRNGTEQRIAQRVNPRYLFRFGALVSQERAASLERLLSKRQAFNYRFPHPRASTLAERSNPAHTGFIGRFDKDPVLSAITDRVLSLEVGVQVNPGVYPGDYLIGHSYPGAETFHNGLEVFTMRPNWAERVRLTFSQASEVLDLQKGVTDYNAPQRFTKRLIQCQIMVRNESEEDRLRGLFERMRGQQGEFYMADPLSAQLAPVSAISPSATSVVVNGPSVFQRFADQTTYRNIALRTRSGMLYRKISSITLASGNSQINLQEALPEISAHDLIGIYWLLRLRFASDTLVLAWDTDTVARCTVNFRSLEDDQP